MKRLFPESWLMSVNEWNQTHGAEAPRNDYDTGLFFNRHAPECTETSCQFSGEGVPCGPGCPFWDDESDGDE